MKSVFAIFALFCAGSAFGSDSEYLGMYLFGQKLGYMVYTSTPVTFEGKAAVRNDSQTSVNAGLLGTSVTIETVSRSWTDLKGTPLVMEYSITSAGRTQKISARFGAKTVVVNIDNTGEKSQKTLKVPPGMMVDDPMNAMVVGHPLAGKSQTFYILDPTSVEFLKNTVTLVGERSTKVNGKPVKGRMFDIEDPRGVTSVYLSATGEFIKAEAPMGMEILPISKAVALAPPGKYAPSKDLAYATSLKTDTVISDPGSLKTLKIQVTAKSLKSIPTGEFQDAVLTDGTWTITVHPPTLGVDGSTIAAAGRQKPSWLAPSLHIPSDQKKFKDLAKKIVGDETIVDRAATKIQLWVFSQMKPDAGIGVLRNANDVLKTKVGVCRDYAILTVTLLRSAGIPARLASGIVNWDGSFYYHAWAEAWDGVRWIGMDSTTSQEQISAAHVKLGEGNVEQAFTFTFLDNAKIKILATTKN